MTRSSSLSSLLTFVVLFLLVIGIVNIAEGKTRRNHKPFDKTNFLSRVYRNVERSGLLDVISDRQLDETRITLKKKDWGSDIRKLTLLTRHVMKLKKENSDEYQNLLESLRNSKVLAQSIRILEKVINQLEKANSN
ncbi:predicted protein [Naegleria gruberi]|uniref:Predicted protein n=1 Tax=Naegleria gruberi TaxID=5762 RepID=D2V9I2_NAEGR|nr:uncharacterized protein NAEGRDRAFT_65451 [Naegleria gruberi]EFC46464.1 predicted protein [Naegleria gruberi]|eukprot:XP_002679208.1 predicted protein [Naegleria gruberi strain NEG-M]